MSSSLPSNCVICCRCTFVCLTCFTCSKRTSLSSAFPSLNSQFLAVTRQLSRQIRLASICRRATASHRFRLPWYMRGHCLFAVWTLPTSYSSHSPPGELQAIHAAINVRRQLSRELHAEQSLNFPVPVGVVGIAQVTSRRAEGLLFLILPTHPAVASRRLSSEWRYFLSLTGNFAICYGIFLVPFWVSRGSLSWFWLALKTRDDARCVCVCVWLNGNWNTSWLPSGIAFPFAPATAPCPGQL